MAECDHTASYSSWYDKAHSEFKSRGKYIEAAIDCFKHGLEGHQFGTVTSCLSIGAADGSIDCVLLRDMMPKCTQYYAVEPELASAIRLKRNLAALCPNVEAYIFATSAEDWKGLPREQKVDVIFLFNVLYYVKDVPKLLTRCMKDWLNPGGQVVVVLCGAGSSLCTIRTKFEDESRNIGYTQQNALTQLQDMRLAANTQETAFTYAVDVNNVNQDLSNFYFVKETSQQEVTVLTEFLANRYPSGIEERMEFVTIITP